MTRFTEKATAITPNRELQPDEYFNETDHLIETLPHNLQ